MQKNKIDMMFETSAFNGENVAKVNINILYLQKARLLKRQPKGYLLK